MPLAAAPQGLKRTEPLPERTTDDVERKARELLAPFGLEIFGWFSLRGNGESAAGLLVGNAGRAMWPVFSVSNEVRDGADDPLNRWTERICGKVAISLGAEVRYPFGEDVWPFQQWAKDATGVHSSPLGLLIHPTHGLWTALRGALVFDQDFEVPRPEEKESPCLSCDDKPCLSSCPVYAFTFDGYDSDLCRTYVRSAEGEECRTNGCQARRACPVGTAHEYSAEQQAFHMSIFARIRS